MCFTFPLQLPLDAYYVVLADVLQLPPDVVYFVKEGSQFNDLKQTRVLLLVNAGGCFSASAGGLCNVFSLLLQG